jgi:hypothetical protein
MQDSVGGCVMQIQPEQPMYRIYESEIERLSKCDIEDCDGSCPDEWCPIEIAKKIQERGPIQQQVREQHCDHKHFWHGKCYVYPGKWVWVLQCTKCRMIIEDPENPECLSPHAPDKDHDVVIRAEERELIRKGLSEINDESCCGEMNSEKCYSYGDNCTLCKFDKILESLRSLEA